MTQRTRYFLLGSSMVIIVGLATGLVAMYGGNLPMRSTTVGPVELAYMPGGANAVGYANVHEVMNSEFRQKLRQVFPTGEEKNRIQSEIGVDIEHDIDTVVVGFTGNPDEKNAVALVRGRFNTPQIEAVAIQHGATVADYNGKRLISMAGPGESGAVAILEPGLLALGNATTVKASIDAAKSGQNITKNTDVMKFVSELDGRNTAWVVGRLEGMGLANTGLPQQARDQLSAVQWFIVNLHVDGGVNGVARAIARDDQAAENLRDVVRGGLAAAHLMGGRDTRLDAVVNAIQVAGTGKDVAVSFTIPTEILDLINGVAGMRNLQQAPGVKK
jgi:hypothetical protein